KLKYKEHKKESSRRHHHSSSSSKKKKEKPYKPPTLYEEEEGWLPPHHDNEAAWRQRMFEAMMDDEGQDPFYSSYEHVQPTPAMTDEEHRQHIVSGMYKRTHAEEIAAEEKRKAHKEKKKAERQAEKEKMAREDAERIRAHNVYKQLQTLKQVEIHRKEYVDRWDSLERLKEIHKKDIPWPVMNREFSFESVKAFLVDPKMNFDETKKTVRKEQTRYHPDKFITRYINKFKGSEREKERVIKQVNEISGWLNELWTQI
ncbi:uncharacterized protein EV154DRAFT_403603, partial [Mucor mucedo]|uniref:uncharacterized protein n=1 Tax=Mucor mucedo TaxID=29922 RepID=UPI00221EB05F